MKKKPRGVKGRSSATKARAARRGKARPDASARAARRGKAGPEASARAKASAVRAPEMKVIPRSLLAGGAPIRPGKRPHILGPRAEGQKPKLPKAPSGAPGEAHRSIADTGEDKSGPDSVFPIVGIGASAGGLEAFTQFLNALPEDTGLALVLVQHLAAKHGSMLAQLLSTSTKMPVFEVTEGTRVEPNHVYVIPPNFEMGIVQGVLQLTRRPPFPAHHMPIDFFLKSLAEDMKARSIGVILSGTASDGTIGLKAIKAEGGITLAQDPKTARYDGMPAAAIAAGAIDFVHSPEGIAAELVKIAKHPYLTYSQAVPIPDLAGSENELHRIFYLLKSATGVDFTHYKQGTIKRRIKRRMVLHKLEDLADYLTYLRGEAQEVDALYQDILIHVTGFFRDPELFETLKETAFPEILKDRPLDASTRIWVPGCSTGEEAYSIAIALLEFLGTASAGHAIQIFGTDISHPAIEKARAAHYPESILGDVTPERLRRFFVKVDGGYKINKTIRDMCVFAVQDVTKDPPFSKLNLISCRNLLIYLGSVLQKRVVSVFHYALKPDGYLVLGSSESIGSHSELFTLGDRKHKIYKREGGVLPQRLEFPEYSAERVETGKIARPPSRDMDLHLEIDRLMLDRFAPPAVLVDPTFHIMYVRGQTGAFLQPAPGEASLNVLKMAREGLAMDLRSAIHGARKTNTAVRREGVRVRQNGGVKECAIEVVPIDTLQNERFFLLLFDQMSGAAPQQQAVTRFQSVRKRTARPESAGRHAGRLEEELKRTREYLESIIQDQEATNEELQSANEEILSANEELQSTNEELQTAKEELQSTNEELHTVNEELHTRNSELSVSNSDLINLLASVNIPIIMVNIDLRIRRYTSPAERLFNLIPSDIGRPITDIKSNLVLEDMGRLVAECIERPTPKELHVQDEQGKTWLMRIRPYKSLDSKIDGAVISLFAAEESQVVPAIPEPIETFITMASEPFVVLDSDLRVAAANQPFLEAIGKNHREMVGRRLWDGDVAWNTDTLKQTLAEALEGSAPIEDLHIEGDGESAQPLRRRISGRAIEVSGRGKSLVLKVEPV